MTSRLGRRAAFRSLSSSSRHATIIRRLDLISLSSPTKSETSPKDSKDYHHSFAPSISFPSRQYSTTSNSPSTGGLNIEFLPLTEPVDSQDDEPLRVLFCGSDELSATALEALHAEQKANPKLIESISVMHRPGKRSGRGLKNVTIPVIKTVAEKLNIENVYERDTFTGWTPPEPIHLIIAVSFGLKVPPRLLNAAKYRGLNIHPSLLPDLRGASPIQSAILNLDKETGITLQDLNPYKFDHGKVLGRVRYRIPNPERVTNTELTAQLAGPAAKLLVEGLRNGLYKHERAQELPEIKLDHAPRLAKIFTKLDAQFSYKLSPRQASAVKRALGSLWFARDVVGKNVKETETRFLIDDVEVISLQDSKLNLSEDSQGLLWGQEKGPDGEKSPWALLVSKDVDGQSLIVHGYSGEDADTALRISRVTPSGQKSCAAIKALYPTARLDSKADPVMLKALKEALEKNLQQNPEVATVIKREIEQA